MDQQITAPLKVPLDKRIEQYVKLRDKIKEISDRHKNELKPFKETLEKLNGIILADLDAVGTESVRTANGTAYKTLSKAATIADKTAFWSWIVLTGEWDCIDYKANPAVISDRIQKMAEAKKEDPNSPDPAPPPGVNYSETWEVGVRRPTKPKD